MISSSNFSPKPPTHPGPSIDLEADPVAVYDSLDDYSLAAALVVEAANLADEMLREGLSKNYKRDISDVVTAADHAAEELLVARLARVRSADGVLGEEGASSSGTSGRTWVIDPVDGTYNFIHGIPQWCCALALIDDATQEPILGAVYHPAVDELWLGGLDHPTTLNGEPLAPLDAAPLNELSLATYIHPATMHQDEVLQPFLRVARSAATLRILGSGSLDMSFVAGGRLGAWSQHSTKPWDWYPGAALVRAAGGVADRVQVGEYTWFYCGNETASAEIVQALTAS